MAVIPDPTDAELDEWERQLTEQEWTQSTRTVVSRLTKALRASRQQTKAKAAVIQTAREVVAAYDEIIEKRAAWKGVSWKRLRNALAALDKGTDDAG